ncbi:hypothetical protein [Peribacillus butanolivorans]|uniref:hypothetical protein n=1 Tax=Peribacillus butanolivorans TaxID=421767 RepID=UPI0036DCAACF
MSKFEYGDEIDKHLVKVIVHEFWRCRFAFNLFIESIPRNKKEIKQPNIEKVLAGYNSYALFLQHLYEYFLACLKRDRGNTKNISSDDADALFNEEVNKILRNW